MFDGCVLDERTQMCKQFSRRAIDIKKADNKKTSTCPSFSLFYNTLRCSLTYRNERPQGLSVACFPISVNVKVIVLTFCMNRPGVTVRDKWNVRPLEASPANSILLLGESGSSQPFSALQFQQKINTFQDRNSLLLRRFNASWDERRLKVVCVRVNVFM